ncbi:MAG: DUF4339 domain-containing protein [Planctomycetales bacterium]|nr:DUF4339 domain-containing protein [Planctomycetales bacterium]
MGIRCQCPNGHTLNLKSHLAGKRGICPECKAKFVIPLHSTPDDGALSNDSDPTVQSVSIQTASSQTPAEVMPPGNRTPDRPAVTGQGGTTGHHTAAAQRSPEGQGVATSPSTAKPQSAAAATHPTSSASSNGAKRAAATAEPAWYVRLETGEQFGPAGATTLQKWAEEGRIPPTSLLWREGWDDWHQAETVLSDPSIVAVKTSPSTSPLPAVQAAGASSGTAASSWAERDFPLLDDEPHVQSGQPHKSVSLRQRRRRGQSRKLMATMILLLLLAIMVPALVLVVFR